MILKTAVIFLVAIAFGLPTLEYGLTLDDSVHLEEAKLNLSQPKLLIEEPTWPGNLFRPVLSLSLMAGYALHGNNLSFFHLANVLLYGLLSISIFFLVRRVFDERLAFFSSLIFICLPIHTEVVANIVFRTELLSSLFITISILASLGAARNHSFVLLFLCGASYLIALLSKESSLVAIPLTMVCLLFCKIPLRKWLSPIVVLSFTTLNYFLLRKMATGFFLGAPGLIFPMDNSLVEFGFIDRLPLALSLLGKYIFLCLAPLSLSYDYSAPSLINLYSAKFPSSFGMENMAYLLLCLCFLLLVCFRKNRISQFASLWFFVAFAITSNVLRPIGTIFSERLAFLPSLGICIFLAHLCLKSSKQKTQYTCLAIICCLFSLKFFIEVEKWRDEISLISSEIDNPAAGARVNLGYGILLHNANKLQKAETYIQKATTQVPSYGPAHHFLGRIDYRQGNHDQAIAHYKHAIYLDKNDAASFTELGVIFLDRGEIDLAGESFAKALNANNYNLKAIEGSIRVAKEKGNLDQADAFQRILDSFVSSRKKYQLDANSQK